MSLGERRSEKRERGASLLDYVLLIAGVSMLVISSIEPLTTGVRKTSCVTIQGITKNGFTWGEEVDMDSGELAGTYSCWEVGEGGDLKSLF